MSVINAPTMSPASTSDTTRVPRPNINAAPPTNSTTAVRGARNPAAGMPKLANICVNVVRSPSLPMAPLKNMKPMVSRSTRFGNQPRVFSTSETRRYAGRNPAVMETPWITICLIGLFLPRDDFCVDA